MSTLLLQRPEAGQSIAIEPQATDNLNLNFAADTATLSRQGDNLIFSFEDGASIELSNFYNAYDAENMPEFIIEGNVVPGEAFFAALSEDLMPALGGNSTVLGSGSTVQITEVSLLNGLTSLTSIDQDNTQTVTFNVEQVANNTTPTTQSTETNQVNQVSTVTPVSTASIDSDTATTQTSTTPSSVTTPSVTPPAVNVPTTTAPAPVSPTYNANQDILAADAGSRLSGNLLSNDNLPAGSLITSLEIPADWSSVENSDDSITLTSKDGLTQLTVNPNGDFELTTNIDNVGIDNFDLTYTATDPEGQDYTASVTIGHNDVNNLYIETLQGGIVQVTDLTNNTTYNHEFSSYAEDANIGNRHVNGMLLGGDDDTITVENAIGSQLNPNLVGVDDTFIYGDLLQNVTPGQVGSDVINITNLDGTKVRADGNLYNGVQGGNDEVNVETMHSGSIMGDGWDLFSGSVGGDDNINVGTMHSGVIYGDGYTQHSGAIGGDDHITIGTIDTTASGRQSIIIDGDSGDDVFTVDNIHITGSDSVLIDGGLGSDIFNYNNAGDNTMALRDGQVFIKDVSGNNFKNFEGMGAGAGDDLMKLYGTFDDIVIDGGEDMDILLANASSKGEIEDMISKDMISNTEFIVLNDSLNNASTSSTDDLLNKLESEGVTHKDGTMVFDSSWTQGTSIGEFDQYTNATGDMTVLVAKMQLENVAA